jgi:hypothetical protein
LLTKPLVYHSSIVLKVNLPILGKDDNFLFGKPANFDVVNRPPPVIAGVEQTERQNHARSP